MAVSDKVREVAVAICQAEGENPHAKQPTERGRAHPVEKWETKVAHAQAAINALREPTPAMKQAGRDAIPVSLSDRATKNCFSAMIDQARRPNP